MRAILQIEQELFEILKTITANVFSYLPDDPEYPIIHIESIEQNIWVHKPLTLEIEMKLSLYCLGHGNKGILEFSEEVFHAINQLDYPKRIEENMVAQVKNDLWYNDIRLKMWTTHKEEEI